MALYQIPDTFFSMHPDDPLSCVVAWLGTQSRDVWAAVVLGFDGHTKHDEDMAMFWLLDQPELGHSSAVRLFWRLFDADTYAGQTPTGASQKIRVSACQTLAERLEDGFYQPDGFEVLQEDVDQFLRRVSDVDGATPIYPIPEAAVTPVYGFRPCRKVCLSETDHPVIRPFLKRYRVDMPVIALSKPTSNVKRDYTTAVLVVLCALILTGSVGKAVADHKTMSVMMAMRGEIC